jgi:uncharacterized membrane protein
MLLRFFLYGLFGWCAEIIWTASYHAISGTRPDDSNTSGPPRLVPLSRTQRLRLCGNTYLWMLPIYGLCAVLFEPVHDAMRGFAWPLRGAAYMTGIFAVEYVAGWLLRRLTGRCPWDYSYARLSVHGYIRLDYVPVWFAFGLALERVHDTLLAIEAPLRAALFAA